MNGKNNEYTNIPRVWYKSGSCNTTAKGVKVITSQEELSKAVYPYKPSTLKWGIKKIYGIKFTTIFYTCVHSIKNINYNDNKQSVIRYTLLVL